MADDEAIQVLTKYFQDLLAAHADQWGTTAYVMEDMGFL